MYFKSNMTRIRTQSFQLPLTALQGELQSRPYGDDNTKWVDGHTVLTRAGYLYWFNLGHDGKPATAVAELDLAR